MIVRRRSRVCQFSVCTRVVGLHSLDERDSPSKFRVSTPALLYKALPQSYQDVDIIITCTSFITSSVPPLRVYVMKRCRC